MTAQDADIYTARGREAVRCAEVRLVAQALALRAAEARATSIVGWSVAGTAAALTVAFGHSAPARFQLAALIVAADLITVGVLACRVLLPGVLTTAGFAPEEILNRPADEDTAQTFYALAEGMGEGIEENSLRLTAAAAHLRFSLYGLAAAPVLGLLVAGACAAAGW